MSGTVKVRPEDFTAVVAALHALVENAVPDDDMRQAVDESTLRVAGPEDRRLDAVAMEAALKACAAQIVLAPRFRSEAPGVYRSLEARRQRP